VRELGVTRFISKPIFPSAIVDIINEVSKHSAQEQKPLSDEVPDFSLKRILLVEDNEINSEIVCTFLEDTHAVIDLACNGVEAVNKYVLMPNSYDLILMDVHMPLMDGYSATSSIRSFEKEFGFNTPIIAMTANVFREDIERCLSAGMNDHLGKPVDVQMLFRKLHEYLIEKPKVR